MYLFRGFILIAAGLVFLTAVFFAKEKKLENISKLLAGFIAGLLLQAIILCIWSENFSYNMVSYAAMFFGMGFCILAELCGKKLFCWVFPGTLAGAVLSRGNLISLILTVFSVVMLVAAGEESEGNDFVFAAIFLFFIGEVLGYGFKTFLPAFLPVFFAFSSGASIYICSEQIFPESEKKVFNFAGGTAGFIFGMLLYTF